MEFTQKNYLVKFYIRKIRDKTITKDQVPKLYNLKQVVNEVLQP